MSESNEPLLADEQDGATAKKPPKRRAALKAAPKSEAKAPAKPRPTKAAVAKPRAVVRKKKAGDEAEGDDESPVAVEVVEAAEERSVKPAAAAAPAAPSTSGVEEWSPSRRKSPAKSPAEKSPAPSARAEAAGLPQSEPRKIEEPGTPPNGASAAPEATPVASSPPAVPTPAPAAPAAPSPAPEPQPAFSAQPARKYPVYIPRHVARQMEQQGQQAPIAVPADAVPEIVARAAAEVAASSAVSHPRERREPREPREPRDSRDSHDPREPRESRQSEPVQEEDLGIGEGIVEISGKGFGFVRDAKRGFAQHPNDIFVTPELVRRFNLRDGQWVKGDIRRGGRGSQLHNLIEINGDDPEKSRILPAFDELTVVSPMERITLETVPDRTTTRIIDLFTPIGKGQRGLIVAPPRTGKTTLLQHIADAVVKHHPDIKLIMLLVDERPEEVTDFKRTIPSAELMASSNDMDVKSHTRIAQLAIERAKRLVEAGKDVFVLLDSITRVGRAFNNAMTGGGRTMSGGVDSRALEIPRKLFAAARNTEEAGSLTIVATALIETGSRMDDLIFQEFKGTGNMELVLDRKIADQRIYPAIDIFLSGTRREELLIPADDLHKINMIRRGLAGHKPMEAIERLLFFLRKFPTNSQMLREIPG